MREVKIHGIYKHFKGNYYLVEEIVKNKEEKILVYCSSGTRSKIAQEKLIKKGYKNVYNLKDGVFYY